MFTEEQAKTKSCPTQFSFVGFARTEGKCIGSSCMAWRWVATDNKQESGEWVTETSTHGRCGLAGPST